MNKGKTLKIILVCFIIILLGIGGVVLLNTMPIKINNSGNDNDIDGYADLKKISSYKTSNVGDASKVGSIIENLPQPDPYHIQNMFSLQTDNEPYGLTVYYEYVDYEGESEPFYLSTMDNNALILFTYIDNLDHITFAYRDTPSMGELEEDEYIGIYEYIRSDFIQRFGDLRSLEENLEEFNTVMLENIKIDSWRIHYNRIYFESDYEYIIARNGEPSEIIRNDDSSYIMVYKNLGASENYTPDSELGETIPGDDVTLYLDGGEIEGVYAAYISGSGEIGYTLGIENDLTYKGIIKKLGKPQISENNNTTISYQLFNCDSCYVTFTFDEHGNLVGHGFYSGDAPWN